MKLRNNLTTFISISVSMLSIAAAQTPNPTAYADRSITLQQSYDLAVRQSETLQVQKETILQAHDRARSALGNALPDLSWNISDFIQDTSRGSGDGSATFFTQKERVESKFTLQQPLFSGLREYSAMKGFQREEERDRLRLKKASLDLYENVALTFYTTLLYESELKNTRSALKLSDDRLKDLRGRTNLGKSRQSEVLSAQSQTSSLSAREITLLGQIESQRQNLSYYIGQDLNPDTELIDDLSVSTATALETYLAKANQRSDLAAQREDLEAQRYRINYQKGYYWPNAALLGNYYTKRPSFYEGIDWDILLSLNVPIYQGGRVSAEVRQAMSIYRQSKLTLDQMERLVRLEVIQAYTDLRSSLLQAKALEQAFNAARQSYESQSKEYRLGLVNNLDVIQALDVLQEEKRAYDLAVVQTKLNFIKLNVAAEIVDFQQ